MICIKTSSTQVTSGLINGNTVVPKHSTSLILANKWPHCYHLYEQNENQMLYMFVNTMDDLEFALIKSIS